MRPGGSTLAVLGASLDEQVLTRLPLELLLVRALAIGEFVRCLVAVAALRRPHFVLLLVHGISVAALWARGMRLASSDGAVPNHSDDGAAVDSVPSLGGEVDSGLFVIGDDEDSESDGENTSKTVSEEERKDIALREHKLSGLTKGCAIASSDYESLPGCITFGVQKLKAETSSEVSCIALRVKGGKQFSHTKIPFPVAGCSYLEFCS
jgi:hypothetical protein